MTKKIYSREELLSIREQKKSEGQKVGYTSGVFDILHAGHVEYLERARESVDYLIVGLNSDDSVRKYKGPERPINPEQDRATVLAGLSAVDGIFVFSETNNNENIRLLKPDVDIKAGDYDKSTLSSAPIVESYGGEILIIPFLEGRSSSSVIEKIQAAVLGVQASVVQREACPAVFLDRDGTLIKEVDYLSDPEKVELLPGVVSGLKALQEAGFLLIIITNQPGIGFGYFSKEDFFRVNKKMLSLLGPEGIRIHKIYFSPYTEADGSPCRKPGTGMLDRAKEDIPLLIDQSFVVGDMSTDMQLAANAGCRSVLVQTGKAGKDGLYDARPDFEAKDFEEVSRIILQEHKKERPA